MAIGYLHGMCLCLHRHAHASHADTVKTIEHSVMQIMVVFSGPPVDKFIIYWRGMATQLNKGIRTGN